MSLLGPWLALGVVGCNPASNVDDDSSGTVTITITDTLRTTSGTGDTESGTGDTETDTEPETSAASSMLPKFDVTPPDGGLGCGGGGGDGNAMGGSLGFSFIWIVNTGDSPPTVSKIDTQTLQEVGRYLTRADGAGDPSRTSVALSGHAAVANRSGGVTKYYAHDCPPGATSMGGPDSELAWGSDACLAWSVDFTYESQRPAAWAPGVFNEQTCAWENETLWTSGSNGGNSLEVLQINGDDGAILDTIPVPEIAVNFYGAYGGAVDGDGNFWFSQLSSGYLVRVDAQTHAYDLHTMPIQSYGMAVDRQARPWLCGHDGQVARFNLATNAFDVADTGATMYGCMADASHLWVGGGTASVRGIDLETMQVAFDHPLPDADNADIHGTSIDFDGYVWGVSRGTMAFKIDPLTGAYDIVSNLASPYTYSDMTGYGLSNAGSPSG